MYIYIYIAVSCQHCIKKPPINQSIKYSINACCVSLYFIIASLDNTLLSTRLCCTRLRPGVHLVVGPGGMLVPSVCCLSLPL